MRSAKLVQLQKVIIMEDTNSTPPISEVLIRVIAAEFYNSDVHIYEGHYFDIAFTRNMEHKLEGEA